MKSGSPMRLALCEQSTTLKSSGLSAARAKSKCAHCGAVYQKRADRIRSPDFCGLQCRKLFNAVETKKREKQCEACGAVFLPRQYQLTVGQGRFCSNKCFIPTLIASGHTDTAKKRRLESWVANGNREKLSAIKGPLHKDFLGKVIRGGYLFVWVDGRGYVAKHRLVMERKLKRLLSTSEIVHHKDRNKLNNRIGNLELMDRSTHMIEHREEIIKNLEPLRRPQKLTEESVLKIRELAKQGHKNSDLAKMFGCSSANIGYVVKRSIWNHI